MRTSIRIVAVTLALLVLGAIGWWITDDRHATEGAGRRAVRA